MEHETTDRNTTPPGRGGSPTRQAGFTLIEIMAVVVIMGMLMATLAVGINGQIQKARVNTARTKIVRIEQALEFYQMDNARFPTADQGLEALVTKTSTPPVPRAFNPGGYLKEDGLKDPWGEPFRYRIPGTHNPHSFDIWSLGPDGVEGNDDITNWSESENG
ncbi:MAG TPA: type II secretion system protein GspG [Deltaproteobacteria bacterium]|nr:type II secretion system protein GspG [Deltaproteobacteria bacterium]